MYDTIVIGGGPAGMTAALTVARNHLRCLLLTDKLGGQLTSIKQLDNWPGMSMVSGIELTRSFTKHLAQYANFLEIRGGTRVESIARSEKSSFTIAAKGGEALKTKTVIYATGVQHAALGIMGEDRLAGRGVSYCSACDAPYFKNKRVAVVGNTPETVATTKALVGIASEVYLVRAGKDAPEKPTEQYKLISGATATEIIGQDCVTGLKYKDKRGIDTSIELEGVFIEAGLRPNSYLLKELATFNNGGHIVVNPHTMATSHPGLFAAGDVTDGEYKQVALAIGDGMKAGLSAVRFIQDNIKE